jgi:hypothetical protein
MTITHREKKRPVAKAKKARALPERDHKDFQAPDLRRPKGWMVVGFDTSMSALSGAAFGYDEALKRFKGPVFSTTRWDTSVEYFDRIRAASRSHELVLDLLVQMKLNLENDEIWIAQEEPWPMGMTMGKSSSYMKQQAEISGAFLAGLTRYGYPNIAQMNSIRWRQMVAADLGITIHHTKWRSSELALKYNCAPKDSGKFRSKQWARSWPMREFKNEIPDFPDIIKSRDGNKPRPEGSKAKAFQPADEYDALAIAWAFFKELEESGILALDE